MCPDNIEEIIQEYLGGVGATTLGRKYGIPGSTLHFYFKKRGVKARSSKEANLKRAKPPGEAARKHLLSCYKNGARQRSLPFELTVEDFFFLTTQDCHYCGSPPSSITYRKKLHGKCVYNGIDRVDNTKGYLRDNCVPCCGACNQAKSNRPVEEFLDWAVRIHNYQYSSKYQG